MIHHTSKSKDKCSQCKRSLIWEWEDKEETNGRREAVYGSEGICIDCVTKNNNGRPPLGLHELNEIRKRGITKDQYYEEMGY